MKASRVLSLLALAATAALAALPADDGVVRKVAETIRTRCPGARVESTDRGLIARYRTMTFTIHPGNHTGEFGEQTRREEGPNFRGFLLRVERMEGDPRAWELVVPQMVDGPYYPTFFDRPPTADGKGFYAISFSWGRGVDPELKAAIVAALPRTRWPERPAAP